MPTMLAEPNLAVLKLVSENFTSVNFTDSELVVWQSPPI